MSIGENRNVYVGHRYVPKIMGEWDNQIQYEGLSIVTYKGTSYTSKKYVPVGIDISNEDFWVITGNYDAQVETYRRDVNRYKEETDKTIDNYKQETTKQVERFNKNLTTQLEKIELNVDSFGAIGDGVTDDSQAIQNAADYAFENGLLLGGQGTFLISETLKLRGNIDLSGVTLLYDGSVTAVEFGLSSERTRDVSIKLPAVQKLDRTWGDDIGVNIINTLESEIHVSKITDFGVGLQISAFSTGTAYNTFYISHLENNEVNLKLKLSDESGWVNENLFIGGRFSHYSSNNSHLENVSHLVFHAIEGAKHQPNNNVFLKPSLEGHISYYTAIIYGSDNSIINGRYEGEGTKRIKFKDLNGIGSNHNLIFNGYNSNVLKIENDSLSIRNSIETTSFSKKVGSNEEGGIVNLQNKIGDSASIIRLYGSQQDINNPNDFVVDWSANQLKIKNIKDDFPKIILDSAGSIYMGDGETSPNNRMYSSENGMVFEGGIFLYENSWEKNFLRLGNYNLWIDGSGKLRMKNGQPSSDSDGTVVGTQS